MNNISPAELKKMRDDRTPHQLIDVREIHEVEAGTIGGHHIPMAEIIERADEIRKDCAVVIHCRSGARSAAAITALEGQKDYSNLHNLTGGITAWAKDIDSSIEVV